MICVAGDADAVFDDAGVLGSVVPFDATVTLASGLGVPSHGGGDVPAGHADGSAFTCTAYESSLPPKGSPVAFVHVNDDAPTAPEHAPVEAITTPAGNVPDTV